MLRSSNRLPYPLTENESGFVFETDFNVTYQIAFTDDSDYITESSLLITVLSFSITPIAGEGKQRDPRVEQTVLNALLSTFDALPDVVINYVCSVADNQEAARSRLFHGWYLKIGKDDFVKLDHIDQVNRIHTPIVFRRNHPKENQLRSFFEDVFDK